MLRLLLCVLVCLVLGAALTAGSAVACFLYTPAGPSRSITGDEARLLPPVYRDVPGLEDFSQPQAVLLAEGLGWTCSNIICRDAAGLSTVVCVSESGVPFRCLRGFEPPLGTRAERMPMRPVPLPFAANTLVFASPLIGLFLGVPFLRRRRRLGRSLCPACGYRMGTTEVCSECGAPLTPRDS